MYCCNHSVHKCPSKVCRLFFGFSLMVRTNLGDKFSQYLQSEARLRIAETLENLDLGTTEKCVRINSVSSGLAEADLETFLQARVLPSSLMLPKVEGPEEIQWVSDSAALCQAGPAAEPLE